MKTRARQLFKEEINIKSENISIWKKERNLDINDITCFYPLYEFGNEKIRAFDNIKRSMNRFNRLISENKDKKTFLKGKFGEIVSTIYMVNNYDNLVFIGNKKLHGSNSESNHRTGVDLPFIVNDNGEFKIILIETKNYKESWSLKNDLQKEYDSYKANSKKIISFLSALSIEVDNIKPLFKNNDEWGKSVFGITRIIEKLDDEEFEWVMENIKIEIVMLGLFPSDKEDNLINTSKKININCNVNKFTFGPHHTSSELIDKFIVDIKNGGEELWTENKGKL